MDHRRMWILVNDEYMHQAYHIKPITQLVLVTVEYASSLSYIVSGSVEYALSLSYSTTSFSYCLIYASNLSYN